VPYVCVLQSYDLVEADFATIFVVSVEVPSDDALIEEILLPRRFAWRKWVVMTVFVALLRDTSAVAVHVVALGSSSDAIVAAAAAAAAAAADVVAVVGIVAACAPVAVGAGTSASEHWKVPFAGERHTEGRSHTAYVAVVAPVDAGDPGVRDSRTFVVRAFRLLIQVLNSAAKPTNEAEIDSDDPVEVMLKESERAGSAGIALDSGKVDLGLLALVVSHLHVNHCRRRLPIRRHRRRHLYLRSRQESYVRALLGTITIISNERACWHIMQQT
jgi:hypothetical protein